MNIALIIFGMIITNLIALYFIKEYTMTHLIQHAIIAIIFYFLMLMIFYKMVDDGYGVAITNILWCIISILCGLFIGVVIFNEDVLLKQKIGSLLGIIGVILIV